MFPEFYAPEQVSRVYVERAGEVMAAGEAWAKAHGLAPAAADTERIAAFGIDVQVAFCTPGASLFVPGAVEDTTRAIEWLYRNVGQVTELIFSLDTHQAFQIFHPAWWVDAEGRHPAPLTPVSAEDVRTGRWRAPRAPEASLDYVQKLEAAGKYVLTVWPYHALLGGLSQALVPAMMEAALFHAAARGQPTHFELKGLAPLTENYSVLSPEVTQVEGREVGAFNEALFSRLMSFDRVYVFGQAKSHCVLSTMEDLLRRIDASDPALAGKLYVLEDAMSPVPAPPLTPLPASLDFPKLAEAAVERWRAAGVHIVRTTGALERLPSPRRR